MDKETRGFVDDTETRMTITERDGKKFLKAYAIIYNLESRMIYGLFMERIHPGAVDEARMDRIISKYNHDINQTLGTTWAKPNPTLTWGSDTRGVWYEVELPETATGKDVEILAKRGDLQGSSYEFKVAEGGQKWSTEKRNGKDVRMRDIYKFEYISDLSPVIDPANLNTEGTMQVFKRAMDENGFEIPDDELPPELRKNAKPEPQKKYWFSR